MRDDDFKKSIESIFSHIEKESMNRAIADPLFDFIESRKNYLKDPEETSQAIFHPFKNIIKQVVRTLLPCCDGLIESIYTDWSYYDNNVTRLCNKLYGWPCCADKGRYIVKCAIKWKSTGVLPVFNPIPENYHHPKTGTPEQWMNLIVGLYKMKHGEPMEFLVAYKILAETVVEGK